MLRTRYVNALISLVAIGSLCGSASADGVTADQPEAWLVLYNINSADSIAWMEFYAEAWDIPPEHCLGLNASLDEHLWTWSEVQVQLVAPIQDYLDSNPALADKVIGFVMGYDLPSHYWMMPAGGHGGLSIANALQDLTDNAYGNNPHNAAREDVLPAPLTRETMQPGQYMVCQMDAPTLDLAVELTFRALEISSINLCLEDQYAYYDYSDTAIPGGTWQALQSAVGHDSLGDVPWLAFDSDTQSSPNDAIRIGTHRISGWNGVALYGEPAGRRILAYNLNSFGAVSVRDTDALVYGTTNRGPYVPNAISAGYAAAIGATGEPYCCLAPSPRVLVQALREGRTLGEAYYLASPNDDWAWTCVGDPLMRMGRWFGDSCDDVVVGDANCDAVVDVYDIYSFVTALADANVYELTHPTCSISSCDANFDGAVDSYDIDLFVEILYAHPRH